MPYFNLLAIDLQEDLFHYMILYIYIYLDHKGVQLNFIRTD